MQCAYFAAVDYVCIFVDLKNVTFLQRGMI